VTRASRTEQPGGKTSPEELIAAAHAACFSMALSHLLAQQGQPPDALETSAVATFDKVGEGFGITRIDLEVKGSVPGMEASDFEKAADSAKEGCPVSNALKGNVEIGLKATLA
jgi:osmotically inducible protein OsmC